MPKDAAYYAAEKKIEEALQSGATELDLSNMGLTELPESIGQLTQLTELNLHKNQLMTLPESIGYLTHLKKLLLAYGGEYNGNPLVQLPSCLRHLKQLEYLQANNCQLTSLPEWINELSQLQFLYLYENRISEIPLQLGLLSNLIALNVSDNLLAISAFPEQIRNLKKLKYLIFSNCKLELIPHWISEFKKLKDLILDNNEITEIPSSLAQLERLKQLNLDNNPLNPALQSAYDQGLDALKAYLGSLEQNAEPLYEAKLVLVGEGNVGKTTLLKALKGRKTEDERPRQGEPTTHGVAIDIHGLKLPHPEKENVEIQLNAWDFGGQDVYRVTHQFFFSRRSLYLLVWEPRRGVQAGQVEDWLNMIRLRVGDEARVLIVSTHCKTGERIARIDKPVLQGQYGEMIVGFYEVDSLVPDESTGEMVGIAELKQVIAEESAKLNHVGMLFNNDWKAARDELVARPEPHISYQTLAETCARHGLSEIDTATLAGIMNDLGYIVHYSDDDELREDVVLKPEWLTKAIGFVLENRATQENEGILPDGRLQQVWHDHPFKDEPRYTPDLYPFFLRLMEKYDVSYRLPDGKASLVAQHVPQVRPELPWLPEQNPPEALRRIAMICAMEEDPPGLVPWMIVRTHDYAVEQNHHHRLHWQKGMFLRHAPHGEALLEKRGRDFHIYAQAAWPEHFMNVIHSTLEKLIEDNWPGMKDRYRFMVPCPEMVKGEACKGRFNIHGLRQFLTEGDTHVRCQECSCKLSIAELLLGFEERDTNLQLREIQEQLTQTQEQIAGLDSRIADYFWATMNAIADEGKHGPRLFTLRSAADAQSLKRLTTRQFELHLWCEAEGCQHPVNETGKGIYTLDVSHDWVRQVIPYANFALGLLNTVAPVAGPAINAFFGPDTTKNWGIKDQLDLAKSLLGLLPKEFESLEHNLQPSSRGLLREDERAGLLALHSLLKELDPTQKKLGLHRVATYTGDYRWLCQRHYEAWQPNIPDVIV